MTKKEKKENKNPAGAAKKPEACAEEKEGVKKEADNLWDRYLRLQAEFDNYRKRTQKERLEFVKYANEGLITELLGIVDNFERGVRAADQKKDFALLHEGVDMILKQLYALLKSRGLAKIKALGGKFDPHLHEAIEVEEGEGAGEDLVTEELQAGYLLNGRIVRPAKVRVLRAKEREVVLEEAGAEDKGTTASEEAACKDKPADKNDADTEKKDDKSNCQGGEEQWQK